MPHVVWQEINSASLYGKKLIHAASFYMARNKFAYIVGDSIFKFE